MLQVNIKLVKDEKDLNSKGTPLKLPQSYSESFQPPEETHTIREVIQKTVKIQPPPLTTLYKTEITERRFPINQYSGSEPKVVVSNAEIISQEIIKEQKAEIKQNVVMTQVPRQVVIPITRKVSGSPERHIVFGQERIIITPPRIKDYTQFQSIFN